MKLTNMYFSPTNNTKKIVKDISKKLNEEMHFENIYDFDFTLPQNREKKLVFDADDIVIVGVPVYAGRVPNLLLKYLESIHSEGALCLAVVTFGNRDFDDALIELSIMMKNCGFIVVGVGAFVSPHSFSNILASNRPDEEDNSLIDELSMSFASKIKKSDAKQNIELNLDFVEGKVPYLDYFKPTDKNGNVFEFRKIIPYTSDKCIECNICIESCPMGAIDKKNPKNIIGKCIKCSSCVKKCPVFAKKFIDENFIKHLKELEELVEIRQESYICY